LQNALKTQRRHTLKRKIISIILALLLCVGPAVPAFAANGSAKTVTGKNVSITLTNVVKETVYSFERWGEPYETTLYWLSPPPGATILFDVDASAVYRSGITNDAGIGVPDSAGVGYASVQVINY
jgi:hypothetical protein